MREAERLKIYDEIDDLLANCRKCPKHNPRGHYMTACRGCWVLEQLQTLGKQLLPNQKQEKHENDWLDEILAKGQDMKLSEIRCLLENGVAKNKISRALDMHPQAFDRLLAKMSRGWRYAEQST